MTITKPRARKLATKAEWTLLESSYAPLLKELTLGRLKQKVTRARKLQDKYRDLKRQQRGEARGKRPAQSTRAAGANENTANKHLMFAEALERFQEQLGRLEAKVAKEAARKAKAAMKRAPAKKRGAVAKASRKKSTKAAANAAPAELSKAKSLRAVSKLSKGARAQGKLDRSAAKAHQAHVGARGRRRQARRDGH